MTALVRFLALALPVAVLVLALVSFTGAALGVGPDLGPLAQRGVARPHGLPQPAAALALVFEATALLAFYLLVEGRTGSGVVDGLVAGLAAWLFRGPLLVLTVAHLTRLPTAPFWQVARLELIALPLAGAAIGALARLARPRR
jgi:hypothetical protein